MIDLAEFEEMVTSRQESEDGNISLDHGDILELITRLRQAEKDAARYRWLLQNAKLGIGRNGKDWDLLIDGPAPDSISEVGEWIDAHSSDCVYGPLVPMTK